ncbi:hypothetical protein ACH5RR_006557 [Cinchona calisaya]|uniref:RNase H type-1 domain-containing protein n=1 Tax=Cinchona calisaya TaxID=153742 RepID=A0ABD3APE0_9GENT
MHLDFVIVETDSRIIFNSLQQDQPVDEPSKMMARDCKEMRKNIKHRQVALVYREKNNAAYVLGKKACNRPVVESVCLLKNPPSYLVNILRNDMCKGGQLGTGYVNVLNVA